MAPDMTDDEAGDPIETVTLEVDLMTVDDEDLLVGPGMAKNQPFVSCEAILFHPAALEALDIVVTEDQMETVLRSEGVQHIERRSVCTLDDVEASVLPQLIAVADLHIGESLAVVVAQRVDEKILILSESISA